MFFKANHAFEAVADYTKLPDGTWVVEVPTLKLRVIGRTPIECKHRLLDEFDLSASRHLGVEIVPLRLGVVAVRQ
jgi:hypothetical protein